MTTDDGREFSKLFFISWVPDSCKAKEKMLYASSKQSLRNALSGVHLDHQAADMDDVMKDFHLESAWESRKRERERERENLYSTTHIKRCRTRL